MKRWIHASEIADDDASNSNHSKLDRVPDIDGQLLSVDAVVSWLDRLVEVQNDEKDNGKQ